MIRDEQDRAADAALAEMVEALAPTAADLRPEVLAFALAMERKLRANDHKSHWRGCTLGYLRRRLRTEVRELLAALDACRRNQLVATDRERAALAGAVTDEAADVANFCMMLADVARESVGRPTEATP